MSKAFSEPDFSNKNRPDLFFYESDNFRVNIFFLDKALYHKYLIKYFFRK